MARCCLTRVNRSRTKLHRQPLHRATAFRRTDHFARFIPVILQFTRCHVATRGYNDAGEWNSRWALPPLFFFFFAKFSGKWLTATRTMEVYRFNNEIYRVDDCVDSCECTFFFFLITTRFVAIAHFEWNCQRKIEIVFLRQQRSLNV